MSTLGWLTSLTSSCHGSCQIEQELLWNYFRVTHSIETSVIQWWLLLPQIWRVSFSCLWTLVTIERSMEEILSRDLIHIRASRMKNSPLHSAYSLFKLSGERLQRMKHRNLHHDRHIIKVYGCKVFIHVSHLTKAETGSQRQKVAAQPHVSQFLLHNLVDGWQFPEYRQLPSIFLLWASLVVSCRRREWGVLCMVERSLSKGEWNVVHRALFNERFHLFLHPHLGAVTNSNPTLKWCVIQ